MSAGVVGNIWAVADVGSLWAEAAEQTEERRQKTRRRKRPPLHSQGLKLTDKQRGEMAEAAFMTKACSLGFGVAKPWGDSDRYDFILDAGGEFWRVQVKSAHRAGRNRSYGFTLHGYGMEAYTADDIDALVGWAAPEKAWYIFPMKELEALQVVRVYPCSRRGRSRWEKYREAWGIFREKRKR